MNSRDDMSENRCVIDDLDPPPVTLTLPLSEHVRPCCFASSRAERDDNLAMGSSAT